MAVGTLARFPLVTAAAGTTTRTQLEEAFADAGVTPRIAVVTAQREAILPLVLAGAGATLFPRPLAEQAATLGAVVVAAAAAPHPPGPPLPPRRTALPRGQRVPELALTCACTGIGNRAAERSVGPVPRAASGAGGVPGLEATDQVGGPVQPEVLQAGGGEARRVALGAHHDHLDVVVDGLGDAGVAGRVEAPLELVALDDQGAGDLALRAALPLGPGVDEQRAALDRAPRPPPE